MSPLYKRLRKNTAILWIQSDGNRLPANKSLNTNLYLVVIKEDVAKVVGVTFSNVLDAGVVDD